MFCTACGTKNGSDSNYCKQCGQKLEKFVPSKISEEDFDRALPENERVTALLERAYRARKEDNRIEAIRLCEEALLLHPDSTTAHSLLGQLYEQGGEREQAIREYTRVLELNPGSIADRVKLDQLREGAILAPPHKSPASQVVLMNRPGPSSVSPGARWTASFLGAGALILLGGWLGLQWHAHDTASHSHPNAPSVNATVPPGNAAGSQ